MKTLLIVLFILPNIASADITHTCDYAIYGIAFSKVNIVEYADGTYGNRALITAQGQQHSESFEVQAVADNEYMHGWLSKESSENSIEMIIYKTPMSGGNSELINNHITIGKEVWGNCVRTFGLISGR
jgi:hypothetical protein